MRRKLVQSILCLSLSAAMILGEAGVALATEVPAEAAAAGEVAEQATDADETEDAEGTAGDAADAEAVTEAAESEAAAEAESTDAAAQPESDVPAEEVKPEAAEEAVEAVEATVAEPAEAASEEAVETAEPEAVEDVDALGAKIVGAYSLGTVTGLAYDPAECKLTWNKVAGATDYEIKMNYSYTDTNNQLVPDSISLDSGVTEVSYSVSAYVDENWQNVTLSVTAYNHDELYVVCNPTQGELTWKYDEAAGKFVYGLYSLEDAQGNQTLLYASDAFDKYTYTSVKTTGGIDVRTYTLYKYPVSAAPATVPYVAKTAQTAATPLASVAFKEIRDNKAVFAITPTAELGNNDVLQAEFSNNSEFKDLMAGTGTSSSWKVKTTSYNTTYIDKDNLELRIPLNWFAPGDTIYVKVLTYLLANATVKNPAVTTTYAIPAAAVASVNTTVTEDSILLNPVDESGIITGYEYQRKSGKKWTTIAKQSAAYKDSGLLADTKYTYRVRGYSYNEKTGTTTNTAWVNVSAYTWGSALNLKGAAKSKTAIQLSWSKVAKAEGYEIYRADTSSAPYTIVKDESPESFASMTLVKTIKKAKKVKYKDTKLENGKTYVYYVRAYRTVGKNKIYIQDDVTVSLGGKCFDNPLEYYVASGNMVVSWTKTSGITGYKVEKYNTTTGRWDVYASKGGSTSSVTLPKVDVGSASVTYRIRAYKNKTVCGTKTVSVSPMLPAVKNVKATVTAEGIQVTWSPVDGADYYLVYRTTKEASCYDKTTKTYQGVSGTLVKEQVYEDNSATVAAFLAAEGAYADGSGFYYSDNLDQSLYDAGDEYYLTNRLTSGAYDVTGTSVVDRKVTVKKLVRKDENVNYNAATDTDKYGYYSDYQKDVYGNLQVEDYTVVEGPKAGTEYYYYVMAVAKAANGAINTDSEKTYSMGYTAGAKVLYSTTTAKATTVKSTNNKKKATVTINIKKVSGAKGYAVYRSNKKNGTYVRVGTTTTKSYSDTNVVGGKTYYYKVASYKLSENGTFVYSKLSKAKKVKAKK